MSALALLLALIFATTFLATPHLGNDWFWELGNAFGFAGFAALLFQMLPGLRARQLKSHEWLGYWTLAIVLAHVFWLLVGDATVRVYLQPGAPAHMWLGLVAALGLALLTILARLPDRRRLHRRHGDFRRVHRLLAYLVLLTATLHILLSGFYLSRWWQVVAFLAIVLVASSGRWLRIPSLPQPRLASGLYLAGSGVAIGFFVLFRNLPT